MNEHRQAFALDAHMAFLNHGSFGATPRAVLAERARFEALMEVQPVQFMMRELAPRLREAAATVADFVRANADDLVFIDNATTAVNAVLCGIDWRPGDRIVHLSHVYGAVANTISVLQERFGVVPVAADVPFPIDDPAQVLAALDAALAGGARVAVLDHLTSPTGLVLPIADMVARCRAAGVATLVDGAHAPGQVPVDLTALGCDAYTGNLHKWAFAPKGTALLWVRPGGLKVRPLVTSHGVRGTLAEAFEWPGTRDFSGWLAAPAALAMHRDWGGAALMDRNRALAADAAGTLADRWGVAIPSPASMRAAMAALPLPSSVTPTLEATRALNARLWDQHRVEVPIIPFGGRSWVRISAQIYNEPADYDRLAEALHAEVGLPTQRV
jgi:isopenicillin-N epimerase